ncbi:hypothetical protein TNCV_3210981 [Trichonephila clavipes]|uniref:Reverse transcriptase domain-containing protein n=1 Tax=Trichonephila clavipes TaxID=2585209 RepID=A0A8X6S2U2_TRICX|nr:hypothetical protein TNCV_3210981 [Trichonephila clavipes]
MLFNIAINDIFKIVQEGRESKVIHAFADDLVLLAKLSDELQELLQISMALEVNWNKCATVHISGLASVGSHPTSSPIDGHSLKTLEDGE